MTGVAALIVACGFGAQAALLEAIVLAESSGNPLALAVNGAMELARQPRNVAEAAAMIRWLTAHGYSFDAGLGQVNSANFARLGLDAESVFEPCTNLRAAATVLDECLATARRNGFSGARAEAAALSCYNTGHLARGLENGYVDRVRAQLTAERTSKRPRRALRVASASMPAPAPRLHDAFHSVLADAFATAALSPR